MKTKISELPAVKAYLNTISGYAEFEDLHIVDRSEFDELDKDTSGWDWADHNGSCILNALWLNADNRKAQSILANISHLRALAWEEALERFEQEAPDATDRAPTGLNREATARQQAHGQPCVVIEFGETGGFFVHADKGVHVFNRHGDPRIEGLYRYKNLPIPEKWLAEPAIDLSEEQIA